MVKKRVQFSAKVPKKPEPLLPSPRRTLSEDVEYVIERAIGRAPTVFFVPDLVFFATEGGDAWVLDAKDSFAMQLCRAGSRTDERISANQFQITFDWDYRYSVEGEALHLREMRALGRRSLSGTQMKQVIEAIEIARRRP